MSSFSLYRDFWLRLGLSVLLAFFFVFLGSDSLTGTIQGKYFIADLLSGFSLTFITTSLINIITAFLDDQYPWNKYFATRLLYQLIASVVIPAIFVFAFIYIYFIVG